MCLIKPAKTSLSTPWKHTGGRSIAPPILIFSTTVKVSGKLHISVFLHLRKEPQYPLNIGLCGPCSWFRHFGDKKNLSPSRNWTPNCSAHNTVTTSYSGSLYAPINQNKLHPSVFKLIKKKGKAIPLQAWTGPEGSRRLRFPDFKTIGTWRW